MMMTTMMMNPNRAGLDAGLEHLARGLVNDLGAAVLVGRRLLREEDEAVVDSTVGCRLVDHGLDVEAALHAVVGDAVVPPDDIVPVLQIAQHLGAARPGKQRGEHSKLHCLCQSCLTSTPATFCSN